MVRHALRQLAVAACIAAALAHGAGLRADLSIAADFPGGAAEVVAIDDEQGDLHIRPPLHDGRGWACWWYFRVDGAAPGRPMILTVDGQPAPDPRMAQPAQAMLSADDCEWTATSPVEFDGRSARYRFTAPAGRFWMAWGPPFLARHADELLEATARACPGSELFTLARTLGDRPVPGIRIGDADAGRAVWVHARQHAWEAGASWVAGGFLDWCAGDDPAAVALRETTAVFLVPIMDVDSVAAGFGGKDAKPHDQNRDWSAHPHYPEVAAAQARLLELDRAGRLRVYIDLHNPYCTDLRPFFYGAAGGPAAGEAAQALNVRWLATARAEIVGPPKLEPGFRVADYLKSDPRGNLTSTRWVRDHCDPSRVLAATLETSWNTPHATVEGYRRIGRQLGRTVARFLDAAEPGAPTDPGPDTR